MRERPNREEWVAIDFETANEQRGSACALGVAVVCDGKIVCHDSTLIRPPELRFEPMNVSVHGITEADVVDAPSFAEAWEDMARHIEGRVIIAHNAGFDLSVLRHSLDACSLPYPETYYFCTVTISRRVWPHLSNHRLDTVSDHIGHQFQHHEAEADAVACAAISLACCEHQGASDLIALAASAQVRPGLLYERGHLTPSRNPYGSGGWADH